MQAIRTKYYGPTNYKGSRIVAKCEAGQITMPYRHELNLDGNQKAACELLLSKLGWIPAAGNRYSRMAGGCFGGDYFWVFCDDLLTDEGAQK